LLTLKVGVFYITDPNSFEVLKQGDAGMILISGPQVMQGYLNDPAQTNAVIKTINNKLYHIMLYRVLLA
jgi:acyl-[acyl-carrier-protein]-phospholipid O-acyltransferase/long-chain-fatty-acid--[acyl-carrier-protein] ligase